MQFDAFVQSVTQDEIVPKVVDTVLASNVLTLRMMSQPKSWSGETLKIPVKVSKSTSGGSFDGYDVFSTTKVNTRQSLSFNPKAYYQSVVLSNMERAVNSGTAKVLDLVKTEMESAQQDMTDSIGALFYSDGTGNGGKDFTGLAAAVDDGSVAATYGGLSRSTYTTLQSTVTTGVGALALTDMASMYDSVKVGGDIPSIIATTESAFSDYESLLTPTVRSNYDAGGFKQVTANGITTRGALKGEAGFDALFWRGTPLVADEKCTSGYMYFLNEKYLNWYSLPHPDNGSAMQSSDNIEGAAQEQKAPGGFSWTGFKTPVNQDAAIGQFIVYGEIVNRNPNRSGVLQGIT